MRSLLPAVAACLVISLGAHADGTKHTSTSQDGLRRVEVTQQRKTTPATINFYTRQNQQSPWKLLWTRHAINEAAPDHVLLDKLGGHLITLDERGREGLLPIVIYSTIGLSGKLIAVHSLEALDCGRYSAAYRRLPREHGGRVLWRRTAIVGTCGVEGDTHLFVRFYWGQVRYISLRHGYVSKDAPEALQRAELGASLRIVKKTLASRKLHFADLVWALLHAPNMPNDAELRKQVASHVNDKRECSVLGDRGRQRTTVGQLAATALTAMDR